MPNDGVFGEGYYYKPKVDLEKKQRQDCDLRDRIEAIHVMFPRYGYRRLKQHLKREGMKVNEKRIRRVMKEYGLLPEIRKTFTVATTDSDHGLLVYPNLAKDREVNGPNEIWVADITYIRIATCFVYLAIILDLFSRKVIGWAIAKHLKKELCLEALRMAIEARKPRSGCIHHSDQGVQYACHEYVDELTAAAFQISMSRKGNPYDNAYAESFMKTLKHEEISLWHYETYADVIERVPYFIEEVYNTKRLHSALGYMPPEEYERLMWEQSTTACNPLLNSGELLSS